jgi:TRAP-type mannitol/chloroaromatic compound transport system permease small subunit
MSRNLTEDISELNIAVRNYVHARLDLIKLSLLDKAAKTVTVLYVLMIILFFSILIVAIGVAAFAVWYGETYNDYVGGLLISGGALLLLAVLLIVIGKKLLSNTIIRTVSKSFFKKERN